MEDAGDRRLDIKQEAKSALARLPREEREALLIKCWMSHDARWFMAAAGAYGIEAASRLNAVAAREEGKVEARRMLRALGRPAPRTMHEALVLQEAMAALLTRDLVEYQIAAPAEDAFEFRIGRCFAHENVVRAGVAEGYDCGIFARVAGWWDAFGLPYEIDPAPAGCLKLQGRACAYTFRVGNRAQDTPA